MDYRWIKLDNGRSVYRPVAGQRSGARSTLPCPSLRKDAIAPCVSMADGKTYDSLSALRRTYRADGNPQGIEYAEIGNEKLTGENFERPRATDQQIVDAIDKADAQVARGEPTNLSDGLVR